MSSHAVRCLALVRLFSWFALVLPVFFGGNQRSLFAQETDVANGVSVVTAGVPQGVRSFAEGRWGYVKVTLLNDSEEDQTAVATAMVKDSSDLRYSREVWIPAKSVRSTWIPVFMPEAPEGQEDSQREIVGRVLFSTGERSRESRYLVPRSEPFTTAYIDDPTMAFISTAQEGKDFPYEAALAMRESRTLSRKMMLINERFVPHIIEGWDSIGHVIMAGDRLVTDNGGCQGLRHWIAEGGHLWIQLNETSPDIAQRILGSGFQVSVVDRVPMNTYEIRMRDAGQETFPTLVDLEDPVDFMRVYVDGDAQVLYEIDGWPAAFVVPYGKGEVLVTTLAGRGWVRARGPNDPPYSDPLFYTDFMALDPMKDLAARFYSSTLSLDIPETLSRDYVADRIGYEVPSRGFILSVLIGFCAAIGGIGGILGWKQRLEHLAWVSILLGLTTTTLVVVSGWSSRNVVPPTASNVHLVRVLPETNEFTTTGTIALYQPEQSEADISTEDGLRIAPVADELGGKIRQQVWRDYDRWKWRETQLPPGVQMIETRSLGNLSETISAVATIGPEGLAGQLNAGPFSESPDHIATDAILVLPQAPSLAANLNEDGTFLSGPDDLLAEGQFFKDTLITDEQRRRQAVYSALLEQWSESPLSSPMMLAWTDGLGPRLNLPESIQQTGTTLLAIPLRIAPSPPNTQITIPSALIRPSAILSEFGQSSAFDNKKRQWNYPNAQSTTTRLRFQLPEETLPLTIDRATLSVQCNIPSRVLQIFTVSPSGERTEVFNRANASGLLRIEMTSEEGLQLDANGGVVIDMAIGELTSEVEQQTMANSGWTIRSTRLDAIGTTLAPQP